MIKISTFNNGIAHLFKCFRSTETCDKSVLRTHKQVVIESQRKQDVFIPAKLLLATAF